MYAVPMTFVSGGVHQPLELVAHEESASAAACEGESLSDTSSSSGSCSGTESDGEPNRMGLGLGASRGFSASGRWVWSYVFRSIATNAVGAWVEHAE